VSTGGRFPATNGSVATFGTKHPPCEAGESVSMSFEDDQQFEPLYRAQSVRFNWGGVTIVNRLPRKNGTGNVVRRDTQQVGLKPLPPFGGPRCSTSK
jgi:hypothetical protein